MGRRGYNQVCQIFLLRLKLDCKCCFNVFKKISFFLSVSVLHNRQNNHYCVRIFCS